MLVEFTFATWNRVCKSVYSKLYICHSQQHFVGFVMIFSASIHCGYAQNGSLVSWCESDWDLYPRQDMDEL